MEPKQASSKGAMKLSLLHSLPVVLVVTSASLGCGRPSTHGAVATDAIAPQASPQASSSAIDASVLPSSKQASRVVSVTPTAGGPLEVVQFLHWAGYEIRLAGRTVFRADSSNPRETHALAPAFVKRLGPVAPFDDVVLARWVGVGLDACRYGFVGISGDSAYISNDFPSGGDAAPVVTLVSSPGERVASAVTLASATESFTYREGVVTSASHTVPDRKPKWPEGVTDMKLVWHIGARAFSPVRAAAHVMLEVIAGDKSERIDLGHELGGFQSGNQAACGTRAYPRSASEVGKVTFYEGGAAGFAVTQAKGMLAVARWTQSDGLCTTPAACSSRTPVLNVAVPAGAKVVESVSIESDTGEAHPLDCATEYPLRTLATPALAPSGHHPK